MLLSPARAMVSWMSRQSPGPNERPAPDHYQRRLNAAFSRLPAQQLPPRFSVRPPAERREVVRRGERRGSRQLVFPLEVA